MCKRRNLAVALLLVLGLSAPVSAAVAFDARSEGERATGGTSLTLSHTTTGSNLALYCGIVSGSGLTDVSTVTATHGTSPVSMDILFTDTTTVANRPIRVFRLVAPVTGTHNVVFSWSGSNFLRAVCASFTGVDQADPDDAQVALDGSGGGTSSSLNVSSAADDMVVDFLLATSGVTGLTAGAGQTEVNQITTDGTGAGYLSIASSYEAGAATTTMSWSWTGFVGYAGWGVNINAAAAGGGATAAGLTLGVWR